MNGLEVNKTNNIYKVELTPDILVQTQIQAGNLLSQSDQTQNTSLGFESRPDKLL